MWTTVKVNCNEELILHKINDVEIQLLKLNTLNKAKILLDDSTIIINADSLSYVKGNIENQHEKENSSINILKDMLLGAKKKINSEEKLLLTGCGEVNLEYVEQALAVIELIDEEVIVWNDMFYCCEAGIELSEFNEKVIVKEEDVLEEKEMVKLTGSGLVILKLPTLKDENVIRTKIFKDKIIFKNNCAILRSNKIKLNIENWGVSKVNSYTGTGEVWHIPIKEIYLDENLEEEDENDLE